MFFVLEVKESQKDFSSKVSQYFRSPEVFVQKVESSGILPFYRITAVKHRGKIPWKEIEKAAGKFCKRAIIGDDIALPDDTSIKRYKPVMFPQRVLFNSAVSVLKKLRLDPTKMSITVFDENGYLTDLIENLVMLCSSVRVVTSCAQSYEQIRNKLFSKYGISVVICSKAESSILTSTAIISDKSAAVPLIYRGLLFTNEKRRMLNATVLSGKSISLEKRISFLYTAETDKLTFASALYEFCGAKELEKTVFLDMQI